MMLVPRLITAPSKVSRLFGLAFAIQSPLQDLANVGKGVTLIFLGVEMSGSSTPSTAGY
jgi:hypothetical protein